MSRWIVLMMLIMENLMLAPAGSAQNQSPDRLQTIGSIRSENREVPVVMFDGLKPLLEQNDGKIHVINFWATWCKPCIEEIPHLKKLKEIYGDEVNIVMVSLDIRSRAETELIPFLDKHHIRLPVVLLSDADANAWIEKVDPGWSGAIPATLIYRDGQRKFYEVAFTMATLQEAVQSMVNHP